MNVASYVRRDILLGSQPSIDSLCTCPETFYTLELWSISCMSLRAALAGRRVVLLRHGNTGKAEVDADRELTEKGKTQCDLFRQAWAEVLQNVTNVLCSPVKRTMATAALVVGPLGLTPIPVEDLYFMRPWRTEGMGVAEKELGYAPVGEYLAKFPGVHDQATEAMVAGVVAASSTFEVGDLAIVGHAGYLSFLALAVSEACAPEGANQEAWLGVAQKVIKEANVGEVCGFEIGPAGARYLPNPESTDFAAATSNDAFILQSKC